MSKAVDGTVEYFFCVPGAWQRPKAPVIRCALVGLSSSAHSMSLTVPWKIADNADKNFPVYTMFYGRLRHIVLNRNQ